MTVIGGLALSALGGVLGALATFWWRGRRGHIYLSTGCFHSEHDYCKSMQGRTGPKAPSSCKFCGAPCTCPCHRQET